MMKYFPYNFSIDDDVIKHYKIKQPALIAFYVSAYLNDPEGWTKHGYRFEHVNSGEKISIHLVMPKTIEKKCGLPTSLSCAELGGRFVFLNASRWFHGSSESKLPLEDYRQYMISHEIGHILGFDHKKCPCIGCKAPIMMQQTLGIGECEPSTSV
jgi:hypothetical protein